MEGGASFKLTRDARLYVDKIIEKMRGLMKKSRNILKILLIFFCILILAIGVVITSVGAMGKRDSILTHVTLFDKLVNFVVIIGVVTTLLALVGIYGIVNNKKIILVILTTVVFISFLSMSLIAGFLMSLRNYQLSSVIKELLNYQIENHKGFGLENSGFIDIIQENMECCGIENPMDWMMNANWRNMLSAPQSCCKMQALGNNCQLQFEGDKNLTASLSFHTEGCLKKFSGASKYLTIATAVFFSTAVTQLLMFIGSVFHISNLFHERRKTSKLDRKNKESSKSMEAHIRGSESYYDRIDESGRKYIQL